MNEIFSSFRATRARNTDPQTSHDAAVHAASTKAQGERLAIRRALEQVAPFGMTAREIAADTGIDYYEVSRRISETAGILRTGERRDNCAVWHAEAAISLASKKCEANDLPVLPILSPSGVTECQPAPTHAVGQSPQGQAALDDGVDYFSAQGALDKHLRLVRERGLWDGR